MLRAQRVYIHYFLCQNVKLMSFFYSVVIHFLLLFQPVGFVTFQTHAGAEAAKQDLQVKKNLLHFTDFFFQFTQQGVQFSHILHFIDTTFNDILKLWSKRWIIYLKQSKNCEGYFFSFNITDIFWHLIFIDFSNILV